MNKYGNLRGYEMLLTYIYITIGVIIVGSVLMIYEQRKLRQNIKELWQRQAKLKDYSSDYTKYDGYYHYIKQENEGIDDITWNDLNMETIFKRVNYNFTTVGEEYLYSALRNVGNLPKVDEQLMKQLAEDKNFRENISFELAALGKNANSNPAQFIFNDLGNVKYEKINILFTALPFLALLLFFISPGAGIGGLLFAVAFNMMRSFTFTANNEAQYGELFYAVQLIRSAEKISKISAYYPIKAGRLKGAGFLSYFMLNDKQNDQNIFLQLVNAFKMAFNTDYHLYHYALSNMHKNHESYEACFFNIAMHDLSYSTALWRETLAYYTIPEKSTNLHFEGGYHPLLQQFVANDLDFEKNIILTGSNASGKSTFMKMVALNIILSKGLHTATAHTFKINDSDLYTSMNLEDSIMEGDSYFISEIKSLKRILQKVQDGKPIMILIDEILRGTNTKERVASAESILRYLNSQPNVSLITATHDIELTTMLNGVFDFYYFSETLTEDKDVTFDYELKKGVTKTSNAIELMRIHGYPEDIYQQAKRNISLLKEYEKRE